MFKREAWLMVGAVVAIAAAILLAAFWPLLR
jgi:hypothetical protein